MALDRIDRSDRIVAPRGHRGWIAAALGLGGFFAGVWITHARRAPDAAPVSVVREALAAPAPHAPPAPAGPLGPVTLTLAYSTEATAWLREQVELFERATPDVRVRLQGVGSVEAARRIAEGSLRPTLWMPADTQAAEAFDARWRADHDGSALVREEGSWPRAMALTPMVFVAWESRARVLGGGATLAWTRLAAAARSRRAWADMGGPAAWGTMKFGHTDPSRSQSGLHALALMAYGWRNATTLSVADVRAPAFEDFVRALESADPAGDRGAARSGDFAESVALQGPGRYDVAMMYESQALAGMETARGRWGESFRVYYPPVNVWSDHPLCLLDVPWVTAAEREAARRLADHLRGSAAQASAVRHGFRPADAAVPVVTTEPGNPFVRYAPQGVRVSLAQVADAPSPEVTEALMGTWRRATGR